MRIEKKIQKYESSHGTAVNNPMILGEARLFLTMPWRIEPERAKLDPTRKPTSVLGNLKVLMMSWFVGEDVPAIDFTTSRREICVDPILRLRQIEKKARKEANKKASSIFLIRELKKTASSSYDNLSYSIFHLSCNIDKKRSAD